MARLAKLRKTNVGTRTYLKIVCGHRPVFVTPSSWHACVLVSVIFNKNMLNSVCFNSQTHFPLKSVPAYYYIYTRHYVLPNTEKEWSGFDFPEFLIFVRRYFIICIVVPITLYFSSIDIYDKYVMYNMRI